MRIEIDDAQLYGRQCRVEAFVQGGHATIVIRMDGREFASEYDLTPERDRDLVQAVLALATQADLRAVQDHIYEIACNNGRLPGPQIVVAQPMP